MSPCAARRSAIWPSSSERNSAAFWRAALSPKVTAQPRCSSVTAWSIAFSCSPTSCAPARRRLRLALICGRYFSAPLPCARSSDCISCRRLAATSSSCALTSSAGLPGRKKLATCAKPPRRRSISGSDRSSCSDRDRTPSMPPSSDCSRSICLLCASIADCTTLMVSTSVATPMSTTSSGPRAESAAAPNARSPAPIAPMPLAAAPMPVALAPRSPAPMRALMPPSRAAVCSAVFCARNASMRLRIARRAPASWPVTAPPCAV